MLHPRAGPALDSVLSNEAQAQARAGATDSPITTVANSVKAGQVTSDTRQSLAQAGAQAAIEQAASGRSGPLR